MSDLVSIAEVWRDRARVAEQAASDLDGLAMSATNVVRTNHFGRDCSEGVALFDQLRVLLDGWREDVKSLAIELRSTSARCLQAAQVYEAADAVSTSEVSK